MEESQAGGYTFFLLRYREKEARYKKRLAEVLGEHITRSWQEETLDQLICLSYKDQEARANIMNNVKRRLDNQGYGLSSRDWWQRRITGSLAEYLANSDLLILDGFIEFRLQEYIEELED